MTAAKLQPIERDTRSLPRWMTHWKAAHRCGYDVDITVIVRADSESMARFEAGNHLIGFKLSFVRAFELREAEIKRETK